MIRQVDAIFSQSAFRPLEPLVHQCVEEEVAAGPPLPVAKIRTPRLAHPEDAADFVMEVLDGIDGQVRSS